MKIDGKEIEAESGKTVLQVAKDVGIEIPHLCYHPRLPPTAACRLCVVEVKGARSLAASCALPVSENLEVFTNTERVRKARRLVIDLLLSNHPLDCLTCEMAGKCDLQKYAYELGIKETSFKGEKTAFGVRDSEPFFVRDYDKCILCGRCVSACAEVRHRYVIDFSHRGFATRITTPYDLPLLEGNCEFCGECVSVCPVGALVEKSRIRAVRNWELKKTQTICPYCGVGCTLELHTYKNRIVNVTAPDGVGVNQGSLCVKGRFGVAEFVNSSERLRKPLIRRDGKLEEASWDEALKTVASRLKEIKEKYGGQALGFFSSAKCTNEENYLLQKFARAVLGTNNIEHCARL